MEAGVAGLLGRGERCPRGQRIQGRAERLSADTTVAADLVQLVKHGRGGDDAGCHRDLALEILLFIDRQAARDVVLVDELDADRGQYVHR